MFPNQADGHFLDLDGVLQRSQLLVERDNELPLDGLALEQDVRILVSFLHLSALRLPVAHDA